MKIWVCEMDYSAYENRDGDKLIPWRYYVLAESAEEAERKVYADRSPRIADGSCPYAGAKVYRTWECKQGIV
jgi:hypothetical protein